MRSARVAPPEPIIKNFHNIENRDAVLAYDRTEPVLDEQGQPVTRWDGRTMKKHPITGEDVPDETARVPLLSYVNPRPAEWPHADFIVGNPPFIGNKRMRDVIGHDYSDALRATYPDVPESADFVMYWWEKAALLVRAGVVRRFGFITTNSLRQTFDRRVVERHLSGASSSPEGLRKLAVVERVRERNHRILGKKRNAPRQGCRSLPAPPPGRIRVGTMIRWFHHRLISVSPPG